MPGTADRRLEEMGIALPGAPARTIGFDPATGSAESGKHGDRMH